MKEKFKLVVEILEESNCLLKRRNCFKMKCIGRITITIEYGKLLLRENYSEVDSEEA